jgi:hypothetical protein
VSKGPAQPVHCESKGNLLQQSNRINDPSVELVWDP